jgi:hypothetical protein
MSMNIVFVIQNLERDKAYETRSVPPLLLPNIQRRNEKTTFDETHHPHIQDHQQNSLRAINCVHGLVEQFVVPALIPPVRLFLFMTEFDYDYQQLVQH